MNWLYNDVLFTSSVKHYLEGLSGPQDSCSIVSYFLQIGNRTQNVLIIGDFSFYSHPPLLPSSLKNALENPWKRGGIASPSNTLSTKCLLFCRVIRILFEIDLSMRYRCSLVFFLIGLSSYRCLVIMNTYECMLRCYIFLPTTFTRIKTF